MPNCVYGCRHPLWGGSGTCIAQEGTADYECSCDEGFVSTDSLGNASCVPKRVLRAVHVSVALCGAAALGFLLLTAMRQRRLSTTVQASRRAVLRMRMICWSSVFCGSASIAFFVAAAHSTVYESGMLQMLYTISMPTIAIIVAYMIDIWMDSMPKQLMPADGIAIRVIKTAETRNICMWAGRMAFATLAPFGLMTFFVLDIIKIVRAINLVTATAGVMTVLCFTSVGFHITGIINDARRHASPAATGFYRGVLRTLWLQVNSLNCAAILWISMAVAIQPQFAGARTPIIPISIMVLDGFVGPSLVIYFAQITPSSGPGASMARVNGTAPVRVGVMWKISGVAAKLKKSILDSSLPPPAGKRVIPTTEPC